GLPRSRRPLRLDDLPPHGEERSGPAGDQPRPLAQLRRRHAFRPAAGDPAPRLRPGRHALRPGQQLRPALRLGRDQFRPPSGRRPPPLPRRAGHLHQGRLRHVARPLWPGRRRPQVRAVQPRPVAGPHGAGLRRHLLQPPPRPDHAARGDHGRAGHRGPVRQGALRRHLLLLAEGHGGGGGDPRRPRHAAAHPPAVVLDAQPLGRDRGPAGHPRAGGRRLHRVLAAGPGDAHVQVPGRRPGGVPRQPGQVAVGGVADRRGARPHPHAEPDRREPRPGPGPDGAGLGAARPADDDGPHRGEQRRSAGAERRGAGQPELRRRRAPGHRRARRRQRDRPLGGTPHRM
ncbi:MAG: L-glyceraldehyde 3-phosphate reductase, partial [uncultured Arthrobacter sp.]